MNHLLCLLLCFFLSVTHLLAQKNKKFPNIITDQKKVFQVGYDFNEISSTDTINCEALTFSEPGIIIYLPIIDPTSSKQVKDSACNEMVLQLKTISSYQSCFKGKALYFKLIDGIMLTPEEVETYYNGNGKQYTKMVNQNLSNFINTYGVLCSELFPDTKIYIENYNW